MPGLSLWWRQDPPEEAQAGRLGAALEGLRHGPDYEARVLASGPPFFLGWTAYPGYPLEVFETERGPVWFEGRLFGPSPAARRAELTRLTQALSQGRLTQAAAFLRAADGEFILLCHDRTQGRVFILNDRFGLLPGYLSAGPGRLLFTREPRFHLLAGGSPKLDRQALAEDLIFAYPLGEKTLLADLRRLPPASLLSLDLAQGEAQVRPLIEDNAEAEPHAHLSPEENARNLLDLHDQACARRAAVMAGTTNYLGLTGGYDSRAACLGLIRAGVKFRAFTFDFAFQPNTSADVDLAGRLAQAYGLPWRPTTVDEVKGRDFLRLLRHKGGLNFLGQSFILRLLEELQAEAGGPCQYVTGDVGLSLMDAAPPDQAWSRPGQLLTHLLNHEGFFTPAQAERLTGHPAAELKARLLALLESYPERSLARKYSHFRNYHRVFKWHYEGLDRNRGVMPLVAPNEAGPYMDYALGCPAGQKENLDLYRRLLLLQSDQALATPILTNNLRAVESFAGRIKLALNERYVDHVPVSARKWFKKYLFRNWKTYRPESLLVRVLKEQLQTCEALGEYFDRKALAAMAQDCFPVQFDNIFTLVSLIEDLTGGGVLTRHAEDNLLA